MPRVRVRRVGGTARQTPQMFATPVGPQQHDRVCTKASLAARNGIAAVGQTSVANISDVCRAFPTQTDQRKCGKHAFLNKYFPKFACLSSLIAPTLCLSHCCPTPAIHAISALSSSPTPAVPLLPMLPDSCLPLPSTGRASCASALPRACMRACVHACVHACGSALPHSPSLFLSLPLSLPLSL